MSEPDGYVWRSNAEHHDAQSRMGHLTAYYAWTLALFGDDLAGPAADAGAGVGHFSELLAERVQPLLVLEGGEENLDVLRRKFAGHPSITVADCDLNACQDRLKAHAVRSIFTLDVLEHLPDDLSALRQFHAALPTQGKVYIKVPALPFLFGPVDSASGHFRRYTKSSLRNVVEKAGFSVDKCHYMNLAGVLPYLVKSRILRKQENFSRTFSPRQIDRIQKMMPMLQRLDGLLGPVLGLSVICVATKR